MATVWWSAALLIHYSFLNPGETITSEKYAQQTNEMHQKLRCLEPVSVNRKGPVLLHETPWLHVAQPVLRNLNALAYEVLPHLPPSPDHLPTNCHFFKHLKQLFAGRTLSQLAGERRCFPRVHWILKHGFLCYRNKQTFLIGKNMLIVMVLILVNKDVFEPTYNDLKFMVQNCNYFCPNLIGKYPCARHFSMCCE